jgi:hypothetical protein
MTTVTATLIKVSGAVNYGEGLIFCCVDSNNFYNVLITCNGGIKIRRKVLGSYTTIQEWAGTSFITQGLGVSNVLSITQSPANTYNVSINGNLASTFTDTNLTNGGQAGFYSSIGSLTDEHFPDTPMDIRFKLTSPIAIP